MPNITVRPAVAADTAVILEMIRGLAEYEKLSHVCCATEEQLRQTLFGDRPGAEVLLADADCECVGFALFFPNYSTFLAQPGIYLEDFFVKPHARRRGIGMALLRELARLGVERGCGRMEWSVLDWNEPSIEFYKKLGATPMDEWTIFRLTPESMKRLAEGA